MAVTDQERLLLILEAQTRNFEREIKRAQSVADLEAAKIQRSFERSNRNVARGFNQLGRDMRTAIAALGVGLVVRDAVTLADTWTTVGNRLAFAGIQSERLAQTQQDVADIASRTRSDLDATADLFARMFRSSQDLGASQERVLRVTEIVSKALAGAAQSERQGAIRQLGQGLGSGRLQGDELRSILENSRPIAEAIAREFDTTVGNLRKLGQEGVLESRRVFEAIERAGNDIDAAFARTTFTVADAFTRLRTEAARFVGTNDQTSSSIRGLTRLVDAVADNFELLANAVVVVATVMGGAFAGTAIARAVGGLVQLRLSATAARGALAFFGGPLGIALTALGGTLAYVATQTDLLTSSAEALQRAGDSSFRALNELINLQEDIDAIGEAGETAGEGIAEIATAADQARRQLDELSNTASDAGEDLGDLAAVSLAMAEAERQRSVETLRAAAADQAAAAAIVRRNATFRQIADDNRIRLTPFAQRLFNALEVPDVRLPAFQLPAGELTEEERDQVAQAERLQELFDGAADAAGGIDLSVFQQILGLRTGSADASEDEANATERTAAAQARARVDLERQAELSLARLRHEYDRLSALEDAEAIDKRTAAYVDAGRAATEARATAEAEVRAEREAMNAEAQRSYRIGLLQDDIDIARLQNNIALADVLSDQLETQTLARRISEEQRVSEAEGLRRATEQVQRRRAVINEERAHGLELRALETEIQAAQLRGDTASERALARKLELEERILDLRREGVGEEAAISRAEAEIAALEQADMQGHFRSWFTGGVTAALEGDLGEFFQSWLQERAAAGLESALNDIADVLFDSFKGVLSQVIQSGQDGLGQAVAAVFAGGATGGLNQLGEESAKAADALGTVLTAAAADAATKTALTGAAAAASASQQTAATGSVVVASATLAKGLLAAAAAAQAFAAAGNGGGGGDIAKVLISAFSRGGGKFGGFKAGGGYMNAGAGYWVGERGREFVVPQTPSFVFPAGAIEGLSALGKLTRTQGQPAKVNVSVLNQSGVAADASVQTRQTADGLQLDILLTRQTDKALRSGQLNGAMREQFGARGPRIRRS